jgi:hypothetical protein
MFKLIKWGISLIIVAGIIFIALSFWQGGKPFRWFGNKSEQAGEVLKEKSEEVGKEADVIKKRTEDMKGTTKKVVVGIRKTKEKIKEFTGSKDEK